MKIKYLPRPPLQTAEWTCTHCGAKVRQTSYYAEALHTTAVHWCWVKGKKLGSKVRGFVEMERTK